MLINGIIISEGILPVFYFFPGIIIINKMTDVERVKKLKKSIQRKLN